jgi:hypothetical protein
VVGFGWGTKVGFVLWAKMTLLCLLGMFSFFQPSLGEIHDDLGSYFILEATDKAFSEEGICHSLHLKIKVLKGNDKSSTVPDCFNLVRHPKWWVSMSKCS